MLRVNANQTILAAGTGVNTNSLKFDVSLEYRWGSFDHTTDISPVYFSGRATAFGLPAGPEAQGTTRIQEWRIKVSTIYRVADTERIKDVVRKAIGS